MPPVEVGSVMDPCKTAAISVTPVAALVVTTGSLANALDVVSKMPSAHLKVWQTKPALSRPIRA